MHFSIPAHCLLPATKHRLQLPWNLWILEFVPDPGMLHKLFRKSA